MPNLVSELPFFEKPIQSKIKQLRTKKLLQEQPFYKQTIKNASKKLSSYELIRALPLYDDINISSKERAFREYAETYKVEIINNKTFLLNY